MKKTGLTYLFAIMCLLHVSAASIWAQDNDLIALSDSLLTEIEQADYKGVHPDSQTVMIDPAIIDDGIFSEVMDEEENEQALLDAITRNEVIIEKYPDDPFIPSVLFQVSELYVRKARIQYNRQMWAYEQQLTALDSTSMDDFPVTPVIDLNKTIDLCYRVLEDFPFVDFRDRVLYRIAVCYQDQGDAEKANTFFSQLIDEFPDSEFYHESHFRVGEYFFQSRDFFQAIEHYQELLEKWDNLYFNMALYKLGWSYYNVNDFPSAIGTFIYLLSDMRLLEEADTKTLGKTNSQLRQEAVDYVAICFSEYGGAAETEQFLITENKGSENYNLQVFLKMAEIYEKRNFDNKAIEVYKAILRNWPYYHYAPVIQQKIVACYEKNSDDENAMAALDDMVQQFGPGSTWISNQKKAELKSDAMTQSEKALLDYASHFHSLGQEQKKRADYQVAIEKYTEFLGKFPRSSMAAEVNFRLAECLYEITDFKKAGIEYWNVVEKYGQTEFVEDAAYNRIICYQNLIDQHSGDADSSVIYLEGFLGKKKTLPQRIRIKNPYQKEFLISSNDFVVLLPKVERGEDVLVKFAETLYSLKEYGLAAKVYSRAVRDFQNGKYFSQSYGMLAQSHLKAGNYNAASAISRKIEKLFPDQPELIKKAKNWVASSGLKKAEELARSKQPLKAAESFAKAAMSTSDPEIARISIFRAAAQYDSLGKAITAAHTLERFLKDKPNTPFGAEISYQAAVFREKRDDWNLAFEDYNRVVEKYPQSDLAGSAYLNAANSLEKARKFALAETYYDQYVTQDWKNKTPDKVILAFYKSAEMKHKQKKLRAAEIGYQKTVQQYIKYMKQRISVDDYYAAKSQQQLAKIGFENFMNYEIKEPIEQTIQQKKALFALTIRNYSNVLKFKIAEFSTEAFYKIGFSYELFAAAMASIPLPGISAEDAAVQRAAVTKPLKQEAIKYYRSNLKMAKNGKIKDEWVEESRKRERKLNREMGIVPTPVKKQGTTRQADKKQVVEKTEQPPKKRAKRLRTRSEVEKSQ